MTKAVTLLGDCVEKMKELDDNSVHAIVTDPPYGLSFMGKEWDSFTDGQAMGEWCRRWAVEAYRVLKPGGHIIAFAGSRTYHRMAQGIEDAGFEIRDQIMWMYGSGFPKSMNVGKAIDKRGGVIADFTPFRDAIRSAMDELGVTRKALTEALGNEMLGHYLTKGSQPAVPNLRDYTIIKSVLELGDEWDDLFQPEAEREVIGTGTSGIAGAFGDETLGSIEGKERPDFDVTVAATDAAREWDGWGTALKPAHEPCVLARKPFPTTVAENVLKHGTGALNIDGTRVATDDEITFERKRAMWTSEAGQWRGSEGEDTTVYEQKAGGRWPTNVILSHHHDCKPTGVFRRATRGGDGTGALGQNLNAETGEYERNAAGIYGVMEPKAKEDRRPSEEELIEIYECVPDCPRRILDEQSGFRSEHSPAVLARKPFDTTVAENVLAHGTGALNIDGARIGNEERDKQESTGEFHSDNGSMAGHNTKRRVVGTVQGRFPTNVLVSHHPECVPTGRTATAVRGGNGTGGGWFKDEDGEASAGLKQIDEDEKQKAQVEEVEVYDCHPDCPRKILDEQSGTSKSASGQVTYSQPANAATPIGAVEVAGERRVIVAEGYGDFGGASRFFYCPKPTGKERHSGGRVNVHPTVKPVDLMRYLCRLITPPNGKVLDPFMGSGSTGVAAILEGFDFVGIELDPDYHDLAEFRIRELTVGQPQNMGQWFN